MRGTRLSVVILSYNSLPLLKACIESIYRYNDIGDALEVVLVDNASENQDELKHFISTYFPAVKLLLQHDNLGYGRGNNIGIRYSNGEFILLMNPDVRLCEPVFLHALSIFESNRYQALLGMQQKDQFNKKVHSFLMRKLTVANFCINFIYEKLHVFNPDYAVISGACFFLNRQMFLECGGYDEDVFLYGEERILHERIRGRFPKATISIDFRKSFLHHIASRTFSLSIVELGLKAYFHLQKRLGVEKRKTFKEVLSYYKFLALFYTVKRKPETVDHIKQTIALLKTTAGSV